jgi:hypothetical protein
VTSKFDKRQEGLEALASMIATAYRRKAMQNGGTMPLISKSGEEDLVSDDLIIAGVESDPKRGCLYTETVRIENLLRRKARVRKKTGTNHLSRKPKMY